jgi:hypothetical protein
MPLFNTPSTLPAMLFYPTKGYQINTGDAKPITFDIVVKESHSTESEISTQPIQKGSDLTIHIKDKLVQGSLTGVISNWSLKGESFIDEYANSIVSNKEKRPNRAKLCWEKLNNLRETKVRVKIITALKVYNDVVITRVSADRDGESGDAQEINIQFQQLNVVELKQTALTTSVKPEALDPKSPPVVKQATPPANKATVQTQPAQQTGTVGARQGSPNDPRMNGAFGAQIGYGTT